jgi:hypothetical protein
MNQAPPAGVQTTGCGDVEWGCAGAQPVLWNCDSHERVRHITLAHFHYQDSIGIFGIDPVEMIAGTLPVQAETTGGGVG